MLIAGIIFFVLCVIFCVLTISNFDEAGEFFGFLTGIFLMLGVVFILDATYHEPTEEDVLSGKAVYQETIHITGNDTIKTYEIVWKEENL